MTSPSTRPRDDLPTGDVTFMFTDIEGSTSLLVELGDAYAALQDTHATILRRAAEQHGGTEVNTEGDAFFIVFRSAPAAVSGAIEAQRALAVAAWPDERAVRVRIGLHTGEGRLGGDDYVGIDVNRAARIAAAAHGGQIVVSGTTAALVSSRPFGGELRSLGHHRLKDLPEPVEIWQVDASGLETTFPALRTLDARLYNLPSDAGELIGRADEIERVRALLDDHREVTLTGPGGTGKTRLALGVSASLLEAMPDGVAFVPIEDAVDRDGVTTAIVRVLALRENPARDLHDSVAAHLRDRSMLLVLDNFEQALDAASLVNELLVVSAGLRIIVTSRSVLRIRGEQEFRVEPLAVPDERDDPGRSGHENPSVQLFLERARQVTADFEPDDDAAVAIAAICRRLDGLPLAIELAAARTRVLSPAAILDRLDHALPLLRGGDRDRPRRQQTLTGAIDWSYELLEPDERDLFASLSVFAGGWTLEAAEQVCGSGSSTMDIFDGLSSLVEKSLVRAEHGPNGDPRFTMLHVIHEYSSERASENPARNASGAHAAWVAELVEATEPELTRRDLGRYQRVLQTEDENIRAALRWSIDAGDAEGAARIVGSLWRYWHFWGRVREGLEWIEQVEALPQERLSPARRARVHSARGSLMYWTGQMDQAETEYQAALELRKLGDDAVALADAWFDASWPATVNGRVEEARTRVAAARAGYVEAGDAAGLARVDQSVAAVAYLFAGKGTFDEAIAAVDTAMDVFDQLGCHHDWIGALASSISIYHTAGQPQAARQALRRAAVAMLDVGDVGGLGAILPLGATIEIQLGRPYRAVVLAAATARHTDAIGGSLSDAFYPTEVSEPARAALSAADYAEAEAIGRGMSITEAARFAIAEEGQLRPE